MSEILKTVLKMLESSIIIIIIVIIIVVIVIIVIIVITVVIIARVILDIRGEGHESSRRSQS